MVEEGDMIDIDIAGRRIHLDVADELLAERRSKMESSENPWTPANRQRQVSLALRVYAAMARSADKGATRDVTRIET